MGESSERRAREMTREAAEEALAEGMALVPVPLPFATIDRLERFGEQAGVSIERIIQFAVMQLIAWQNGMANLIMSGSQVEEPEAEPRPVADAPRGGREARDEG